MDYKLNRDFDIEFTEWGDFQTVEGREEFEQKLIVRLHANERPLIGANSTSSSVKEKARQIITRTAREFEVVDTIAQLNISTETPVGQTLKITVAYDTGNSFTRSI